MATQYTNRLKLALPVQGELIGSWGNTVNDEITSLIEEAVAGLAIINTWTSNSHTLTVVEGDTSESRAAILKLTDTGTALTDAGTVICPGVSKMYIVQNATGRPITVKTAAGTGVTIPNTKTTIVFCDSNNVLNGVNYVPYDNTNSGLLATNVQDAIDELGGTEGTTSETLTAHLEDAEDAHDGSAISFDNTASGLNATNVQAAISEINNVVQTRNQPLTYNGSLDLQDGDAGLPATPDAGDTYTISAGGTITVSRDGEPAVSQLVNAGESIVWNATDNRWDILPSTNVAVAISYNNLFSELASTNVQDAIDEVKSITDSNSEAILQLQNTSGVEGIVYRGQLNVASGNSALPSIRTSGDLYQIVVGGVITVSTEGASPVPTAVNPRDQIIWNGLLNRWDLSVSPPVTVQAAEQTITLSQPLALVPLAGKARFYPANTISVVTVRAAVGTAPVGANVVAQLKKNGTVVETITISNGANESGLITPSPALSLTSGDFLTVDVTQVGSSIAGSDLTVIIEYVNL